MIGFNTGYGNKSGTIINPDIRNITGIEFKTGYGYVSGKRNKSG
jgi:hypothetical protein